MTKRAGRRQSPKKVVDETIFLKRPRRGAKLREEVWQTDDGEVTKYNLAYINHLVCRVDHGRVLGYDNSHDAPAFFRRSAAAAKRWKKPAATNE